MKVGLALIIAEREDIGRAFSYRETREVAQRAEANGFDSIWLYDHLLYRSEGKPTIGIWENWTFLSALAEATQRLEVGTLVTCNSFRNPALLAKMAITLDEVSQGRLILGIGAGWNKPEYDAFGFPYDHRVDRLEEALQIIRPLLKDGYVEFQGKYYQVHDCEIKPRGPRTSGPPIMIGGGGPRMLRLTAQYADMWNTGYYGHPDQFAKPLQDMEEACRSVGRETTSLAISVMLALHYTDLAPIKLDFDFPPLGGSAEQVAQAMLGYQHLGIQHIMFHLVPYSLKSIERLEDALRLYRQMADE